MCVSSGLSVCECARVCVQRVDSWLVPVDFPFDYGKSRSSRRLWTCILSARNLKKRKHHTRTGCVSEASVKAALAATPFLRH